jgi:hypothetical protein
MFTLRLIVLSIPLGLWIGALPASAQEDSAEEVTVEEDTVRCISTRRIRRIRIVDDKNILIYLTASHIYHNELQNVCRGLKRHGTFSYNSNDGLFCEGDGIGAMTMGAWDNVRPDVKCWLGPHRRISREEADEMRRSGGQIAPPEAKPLPMPPPLVIGTEELEPESEPEPEPEPEPNPKL